MLAAIAHRGPDGCGLHRVDGQVVQGHLRLAIIDPEHGQQPMLSVDGRYSIVFNGAIYNYLELRAELERKGVSFRTRSDTEVLLALLASDGAASIARLNGMFAFVFHDRLTNRWIAARDPFGIKPLYFTRHADAIAFASEIKALLRHPQTTARLDLHSLAQYVVFQYTIGARTMFERIEKVPHATYVEGRGATIEHQRRYWTPNTTVAIDDEREAAEQIRALLHDSVRVQLRSDVPLGGYLSGGLDSSAVCSLATKLAGTRLSVFHGRFTDVPGYDESSYARALADAIDADLFITTPTHHDFVELMPQLVHLLDEPVAGPGAFPQYIVSRLAASKVKVALGGQGGDEIFGGYARYLVAYLEQALKGAITETQEEGRHVVTLENVIPQLRVLKSYFPLMQEFWSRGLFESMDRRYFALVDRSRGVLELLAPELRAELDVDAVFEEYLDLFNRPQTTSYINKMLAFDMSTLLPALLQVEDRMSMGASLESRVPLLDTRLVDLLGSVSPSVKFSAGVGKHALKLAVGDILPPAVLDRGDKMGFPVPLVEWMQHSQMSDFVNDQILGTRHGGCGLIDRAAAEPLLTESRYSNRQLWGLLSLQMWHETFLHG
jgi:asparagine synthase (glutamine-hydrolysing)